MSVFQQAMKRERPDGWWYPWIFVGAMLFVFVINGIMVFIALDSWTGLETESHYRKGLAYNQNLEAARAQEALGWNLNIDLTPTASDGTTREADLKLRFVGPNDVPMNDLDVMVVFFRPTHEGYDQEVLLTSTGDGRYEAQVLLPLAGQWAARVHAFRGRDVFQTERRVIIR